MKKYTKLSIIGILSVIVAGSSYAASTDAGSSNDPIVTKSYVDQQIFQLKLQGGASANTSLLESELASQSIEIQILKGQIEKLEKQKSTSYEVVTVPEGKAIFGMQGTEIIVRSGEGMVLASSGAGLQNMTEGTDVKQGSIVPRFHLIIIPREDGRGIYANKELIVMVRGGYTIQ